MKEKKIDFFSYKNKGIFSYYSYRWKYVFRPKKETWEEM